MPAPSGRPAPQPDPPLDALWRAPAIVWAVVAGMGVAALLAIAQPPLTDRWVYFGLACLMVQWTLLLALAALYLVRGLLARLRPLHVAGIALLLLVLSSWLVHAIAQALVALVVPSPVPPGWSLPRMAGLTLCVGLLGLAVFYHHWRATQLAVQAKQAQLEALQARIRPHFLFNTLNTGVALVRERPGEAERLLLDLSDLFRAALAGPPTIPLEDELALARRYLEIEQLRFGPRLQVKWEVPAVLPAVPVPTLSVQPLVENAIRHGIERSPRGGEVRIVVVSTGSGVRVTVSNSLPSAAGPATHGHQVGLSSVRARVQALTGDRGGVETHASGGRHVAVLYLPAPGPGADDPAQATTR
ncbi:sensor histidine kinase [Pseudoxanthomonas sp. GW2]|uniref:sensor histidine kinase n=1 Tax=Pseudoxanthomonas sp. GW2 TaxID=1211114 RepID=UPI00030EB918|nr:histidine kinase [Pseudoxanthomonas sp. GW2]